MQPTDKLDPMPPMKEDGPRGRNTRFTKVLLITLTVSLGISLVANAWLYRLVCQYAGLAGDQPPAEGNAPLPPPEANIVRMVLAGDSDIQLWNPLPELKGTEIIQRGVGGDRTRDLLLRLENDVVQLQPAVVVLTIGGNDLEDIGLVPDEEKVIIETCEGTIRAIVDHLRQHQIQVVLLTIFPYGEADPTQMPPSWSDAIYGAVQRVNATIRTMGGPGVTVINCDPFLTQANGRRKPAYSLEFEHLNPDGYQALNEGLSPVLEAVAKQAKQ